MAEIRYHKYPEFVHTLQNRHNVYNHSLDVIKELERKGEVFVIQPDKKLDISRMENNLEVIQQAYDMGEKRCPHPYESTERLDELAGSINRSRKTGDAHVRSKRNEGYCKDS